MQRCFEIFPVHFLCLKYSATFKMYKIKCLSVMKEICLNSTNNQHLNYIIIHRETVYLNYSKI